MLIRARRLLLASSGALLLAVGAHAQQTANPAGLSPDTAGKETGQPSPAGANSQDKLFVRQAALGGRAEVDLGKLAQKRAQNPAVREFADRMVRAHDESNQKLLRVGRGFANDLPKELDAEHQTIRDDLQKASGKNFDLAYVASQVQDHQRAVNLLLWHLSTGQNDALRKYSSDMLPEVMSHLESAKQQLAALTSNPPPQ